MNIYLEDYVELQKESTTEKIELVDEKVGGE
jgi:hypothetical protein